MVIIPTTIKCNLSVSSIEKAIKQVNTYEKQLVTRCNVFCGKLAELGISTAKAKIGEAPLGKYVKIDVKYEPKSKGCKAIIYSTGATLNTPSGSINTLLMCEFGAGIHYNHTANPKAAEFGMGVGTYPDQTHAFEDSWSYLDENGEWHRTHGIKATMPMYSADVDMILNIRKIAKEVFSS